jgi:hypothetical protein
VHLIQSRLQGPGKAQLAAHAQKRPLPSRETDDPEPGNQNPALKKFPWLIYLIVFFLIAMFALAPIGSVVIAGVIANSHGCHVDEGSLHPCVIGGKDYGETLYTLGVLGWLMLITLPAGAVAGLVWVVVLILHRARWRRRLTLSTG